MTKWKSIDDAPRWPDRKNFLVCAYFEDTNYLTDPWVVFRDCDNTFVRWPHDKPPTHWAEVPEGYAQIHPMKAKKK